MDVILSLFDESGNALRPFLALPNIHAIALDIQNDNDIEYSPTTDSFLEFAYADLSESISELAALNPILILGFPPCTDLAVSGASRFPEKRAKNPNFQTEAVSLARQVETLGLLTGAPWMLENPISVLATLWRKPDFYFDPCDYGGYLPEDDTHPRYPDIIPARDAYKKRTSIWCGNGFTKPPVKPVVPLPSSHIMKLGGRSPRTKRIRSETPRGFALAVKENFLTF